MCPTYGSCACHTSLHNHLASQSIVDVPFSPNGPWNPKDFTNLSHLTIRNPHHQGPMPTAPVSTPFDCTAVAGMKNLRVLVLAAGFNEVTHLSSLPTTCQQMMINCPGQPQVFMVHVQHRNIYFSKKDSNPLP